MEKSADAFRTISEVATELDVPQHVLRFWESKFPQIKPLKRAGGRRYYRPHDIDLLRAIKQHLYEEGFTIKGVQRILKERGVRAIAAASREDAPIATAHSLALTALDDDGACSEAFEDSGPIEAGRTEGPGDEPMVSGPVEAIPVSAPRLARGAQDVEKLRAILADLERCAEILSAARRA